MCLRNNRLHSFQHKSASRSGVVAPLVVFGLLAVLLLGIGLTYYFRSSGDEDAIAPILAGVTRGEFVSQVTDQGEVQSSENIEIRCEVRARNGTLSVISVVNEGIRVKEGDFLVQLDSTSFEKELEQQKIAMAMAETSVIQSKSALATSEATLNEYIKGVFVENKKMIENEIYDGESMIKTAQQELKQAEAVYEHSKKLHAKAFITRQTLEADGFAVERAEIALKKGNNSKELAEKKMEVLKDITYEKSTVQLKSDIEAAAVKLSSDKEALQVESTKLDEIKSMIEKCNIVVPKGVSGQVVFAKESSRGGNDWVLEEGTSVRENQVLIRLPNAEKMEVKALINEQSITRIEPNMPVSIKVDALNNTTLRGVVTKVNQYAESSGWMSSSIRKYAVFVRIVDPPSALKPGMNSSVSIQVQYEPDALMAPIQTIYGVQNKQFCLAKRGENDWQTLEVELGGDNSQMVYLKSGVEEGTELVMNPGAYKEYMDLPELKLDTRINISDDEMNGIGMTSGESVDGPSASGAPDSSGDGDSAGGSGGGGRPGGEGGGGGGRPGGGGGAGFALPASGQALISDKDTDGDGKLTKDEAGSPYSFFFDRVDTDSDGFLSVEEADASIKQMKERMQSGGGGGGGGRGGPQ